MTVPDQPSDLHAVHLLALPVPVASRSREHFEGLVREFSLVAVGSDGDEEHVPARLLQLVQTVRAQFSGALSQADQRLEDAIDRGDEVVDDHVLVLPPAAAPAARGLGQLLEEADAYCAQGRHLLTLAAPADCAAYRRWYLGQVVAQLDGQPPVAWPDSDEARGL